VRHIDRTAGERKVFKNTKEYRDHARALDAQHIVRTRQRSRKARRDISRKTSRQTKPLGPEFIYSFHDWPRADIKPAGKRQKFSLIHPTRKRPHYAWLCINMWAKLMSPHNDLEYVLSLDCDDAKSYLGMLAGLAGTLPFKVTIGDNRNVVQALNRGAAVSTGDVLVYLSDDFECPENWDNVIQRAVKKQEDWVLHVHDGIQDKTATISILSREYYKRHGRIYHPDYMSMFVDNDFTEEARAEKKLIRRMDITFKHNHYSKGGVPYDETYAKENSPEAWAVGERVFNQRAADGFGVG